MKQEPLPDDWDLEMEVWEATGFTLTPDGGVDYLNKDISQDELKKLLGKLWYFYCEMEQRAINAERLIEGNV